MANDQQDPWDDGAASPASTRCGDYASDDDKPINTEDGADDDKPINTEDGADDDKPINMEDGADDDKPINMEDGADDDKPINMEDGADSPASTRCGDYASDDDCAAYAVENDPTRYASDADKQADDKWIYIHRSRSLSPSPTPPAPSPPPRPYVSDFLTAANARVPAPEHRHTPAAFVERNRAQRAKNPGYTCWKCKEFYDALIEQGIFKRADLPDVLRDCSRHKSPGANKPETPPDIYDIDFSDPAEWAEQDGRLSERKRKAASEAY